MKGNSEKTKDMIQTIRDLRRKVKDTMTPECQCINCSEQRGILEIRDMGYKDLWKELEKAEREVNAERYYKILRELCDRNESLARTFQENGIKNIKEAIEFLKK